MKKVYITSLHLKHGGVEMAISLLANALIKRGYKVTILCTYNFGTPAYKLDERITIEYLTNVLPNRELLLKKMHMRKFGSVLKELMYAFYVLCVKKYSMINALRNIKEGCVISTRNEHSVLLSKYGKANVKKIAQLHHDHRYDKKLLYDFKKKYTNIDYFVLLTEQLREEVSEVLKKNKKTKCITIPNFLNLDYQQEMRIERKNQVIAVGRLHPVKRFNLLIDMWKDSDLQKRAKLLIIGDGEDYEKLQKQIDSLSLNNSVKLLGEKNHDEVMDIMKNSMVYAMTSETEGFPFVLVEAMSNALPMVAYDVRVGPRAIIKEGETGYLVEDGNQAEYNKKLKLLLDNDEIRSMMSIKCKKECLNYSEELVMKKWLDIL